MTERFTCEQCGREGKRGFKVYPADQTLGRPELVVCAATAACRARRWRRLPPETRAAIRAREDW